MTSHRGNSSPNITKYLARYAEPTAQMVCQQLPSWDQKRRYQQVLVIPCFDETANALAQVLGELPKADPSRNRQPNLVVVVVNAPKDAQTPALHRTRAQLATLESQLQQRQHWSSSANPPQPSTQASNMTLGRWQLNDSLDLLVVDRCSSSALLVDPKQGVGLARKLGADIALALIQAGMVQQPWIYSTDADAQLPQDYFDPPLEEAAALCLPFAHRSTDPELARRSQLYEQHMRGYATGLAQAGSPYGYLSLGSALVCNAEHYAQVRGFPKRNAGEDFYLLNKLAKTGAILTPASAPILLQARYSNRVPFGTGPALQNWPEPGEPFTTYPDQAFTMLGELLELFARCAHSSAKEDAFATGLTQLNSPIPQALASIDPKAELSRLFVQNKPPKVKLKAAQDWFDALKTLRFVRIISKRFPPRVLDLT